MIGRSNLTWHLVDAEERAKQYPDSFVIPVLKNRENLRPGDLVKLIFELDNIDEASADTEAERMWVKTFRHDNGEYTGLLDNDPYFITSLKAGDEIKFSSKHIIALDGVANQQDKPSKFNIPPIVYFVLAIGWICLVYIGGIGFLSPWLSDHVEPSIDKAFDGTLGKYSDFIQTSIYILMLVVLFYIAYRIDNRNARDPAMARQMPRWVLKLLGKSRVNVQEMEESSYDRYKRLVQFDHILDFNSISLILDRDDIDREIAEGSIKIDLAELKHLDHTFRNKMKEEIAEYARRILAISPDKDYLAAIIIDVEELSENKPAAKWWFHLIDKKTLNIALECDRPRAIIYKEVKKLRSLTYSELELMLREEEKSYEIVDTDGEEYQIYMKVRYDDRRTRTICVGGTIYGTANRGFLYRIFGIDRSLFYISFTIGPDGKFIGE